MRALARRSLFDVLGPRVGGARTLDLFAGAGTVGFEALSRGASELVLVEKARPAIRALRTTINRFDLAGQVRIVARDVLAYVRDPASAEFDFIYLGPPYRFYEREERIRLDAILEHVGRLLSSSGALVLESPAGIRRPTLSGLTLVESRAYGDTTLHFFDSLAAD